MNTDKDCVLNDVLVVTVKKSFWASNECTIFPNRMYATNLYGHSRSIVNTLITVFRALFYCFQKKPKLVLFGSSAKVVPFFIFFKMLGFFSSMKIITTTQLYFKDSAVKHIEKIIVYSKTQILRHRLSIRNKYVFIPLPADGIFEYNGNSTTDKYIFSGGGDSRDFSTLIQAVKGLDIKLKIVTFSPRKLGYNDELPSNCDVYWQMPLQKFLKLMADSLFVVVPLQKGNWPHGQTTVVQALCSGKAVISNKDASIEDYITDRKEGILVPAGDVNAYRKAIVQLTNDDDFRNQSEIYSKIKAKELTYEIFANNLIKLCKEVLKY